MLKIKPYKSLVISILTIMLSSCSPVLIEQTSIPTPTELEITSNIYANALAYGDYLSKENSSVEYCSNNNLAIYSTSLYTFGPKYSERFRDQFPEMEQETWENFLKINLEPINLPSNLNIGCKYTLITTESNIESSYYFSRIGFNSLKNEALVYRHYTAGDYCYGSLLYFELIDGTWKIVGAEQVVIC